MQSDADRQSEKPNVVLSRFFNKSSFSFSYGSMPVRITEEKSCGFNEISLPGYDVNISLDRLKLKFHGENFLVSLPAEQVVKLNYGRIMHEVFSLITTADDVQDAVKKLVVEGKIPENQKDELVRKIFEVITAPLPKEWFEAGSVIIKETDILLPSGSSKRPDRVILKNDKAIIVDFKFGVEKQAYISQVNNYRKLMNEMGYSKVEAFLWYVDNNKIITV
jgi:ATP-dependent helicase/nuclease subunit A